jgi:polyvinyl alcohol dehydrogenase (cytochrome)
MTRSVRTFSRRIAPALAVLISAVTMAVATPASAVTPTDWTAYLGGPAHTSASSDPAITPAIAASLVQKWHFNIGYVSSPVVADGSVFIGSFAGWFYKINALTGLLQKKIFLGFQPKRTCPAFGFASTVTVARDPSTGLDTVYVAAPNGYLYAFDEATLKQNWRSVIAIPSTKVNNYFQWSSPTVANGKIYVGISSSCDIPLVRGGIVAYQQATGKKVATFHTVPKGAVGGSVWSTVAVDGSGDVYATTGNGPGLSAKYDTDSILKLSPALKLLARFQVPKAQITGDGDFGGSPTLFTTQLKGTTASLVGACDKNGIYYALRRSSMKVIWTRRIGASGSSKVLAQCQSAAAFDGRYLYMAGPAVTIKGKVHRGSVERINPATGAIGWRTGLPEGVLTSPAINASGVIGVGTYDNGTAPNATYLVNAANGALLKKLDQGDDFPQSAFADGWVYTAGATGLYAWGP